MKAPAFQFYADDFIGGTITMTHEERGLYILALCLQWGQGALSSDDIARLAGSMHPASIARVESKFDRGEDGKLRNARLESERKKQNEYREERAQSGKRGAESRWHGSANGSAIQQPIANDGSPSPSPSPISGLQSPSPSPSPTPPSVPPEEHTAPRVGKRRAEKMTDEDFLATLRANPAYVGIDFDQELGRMRAWLLTPRGKRRKLSRQFVVNWLNKVEVPMKTNGTDLHKQTIAKYGW